MLRTFNFVNSFKKVFFYRRGHCIPFSRSIPLCGTGPTGQTPRTPMNENTAFIDASNVKFLFPKN